MIKWRSYKDGYKPLLSEEHKLRRQLFARKMELMNQKDPNYINNIVFSDECYSMYNINYIINYQSYLRD